MNPTTMEPQIPSLPKSSRKARQIRESEEPGTKPKKINSEVRKQQNRIASRNYREKRKRKLQYLEQLAKDDNNSRLESEPSPEEEEEYTRSLSADYQATRPNASPYVPSCNCDIGPTMSNTITANSNMFPATNATFDEYHPTSTYTYSNLTSHWNTHNYSTPPPVNSTWNVASWTSGTSHSAPVAFLQEAYGYTPTSTRVVFGQTHAHSHYLYEGSSSSDPYRFGSPYGTPSHTSGMSNTSPPISSTYYPGYHSGSP